MQSEPLKESVDYPNFIKDFVSKKLAEVDAAVTDEMALYIEQDVESYLLDAGKTVAELDATEMHHIKEFILERVNDAGGSKA